MYELIENVLTELSFTAEYVNRIGQLAKEELSRGLIDGKVISNIKAKN